MSDFFIDKPTKTPLIKTMINLTPHTIHIYGQPIPSIGELRVKTVKQLKGRTGQVEVYETFNVGLELNGQEIGVEDLESLQRDHTVIVSSMALDEIKKLIPHSNFVAPFELLRDEKGRVIGCKNFRK